jgi:hypothetical protein
LFAKKEASSTITTAMLQRTRGKRIKRAAAMPLAGQRRAMPFGARVIQKEMQADANSAVPTRISLNGEIKNRALTDDG